MARPYGAASVSTALQFALLPTGGSFSQAVMFDSAAYSARGLRFDAPTITTEDSSVYVFSRIDGVVRESDVRSNPITLRLYWTPERSRNGCVASFSLQDKR